MMTKLHQAKRIMLGFDKPFNMSDAVIRCDRYGIYDSEIVVKAIDDLLEADMLRREEVASGVWAYTKPTTPSTVK